MDARKPDAKRRRRFFCRRAQIRSCAVCRLAVTAELGGNPTSDVFSLGRARRGVRFGRDHPLATLAGHIPAANGFASLQKYQFAEPGLCTVKALQSVVAFRMA